MKKYFLLIIVLLLLLFFVKNEALAGTGDNVSGWIWGGTEDGIGGNTSIGWISANSTNTGSPVSYGVTIPIIDGNLSGYAWSENLGWISFNQADLSGCPDGNCVATRSGNKLVGWARVLGIKDALATGNSGGWQGWIHLGGSGYNITINSSNGTIITPAFAWSDELGWLDFSRIIPPCTPLCGDPATHCIGTYASSNNCGTCTGTMAYQCVCPTTTSYVCKDSDCGNNFPNVAYDICGTSVDCSSLSCPPTVCNNGCNKGVWKEIAP